MPTMPHTISFTRTVEERTAPSGCGYCMRTQLAGACPICGAEKKVSIFSEIGKRVDSSAAPTHSEPTLSEAEFRRRDVLAAAHHLVAAGQKNVAIVMVLGLLGPTANNRVQAMISLDERCRARGFISRDDDRLRELFLYEALVQLGEDVKGWPWLTVAPSSVGTRAGNIGVGYAARAALAGAETLPATVTVPDAAPTPQVLALPEGVTAPLRSGDWAGLQARVNAGVLTEEQAREFGRIWISIGQAG